MVDFSPAFTPVHSFIGGLMLAAGVHSLLSQAGTVLGISGFFHESVSCLVDSDPTSLSSTYNGSEITAHHAISPEDDAIRQSEKTYTAISKYFITGLLAGGAGLAAAQLPIESALGVKIFDSRPTANFHLGQGISRGLFSLGAASVYVPSAFWGASVGFGTKLGSGCTSGHFLCGLSRLSPRSIVATAIFFSTAVGTHLLAHSSITKSRPEVSHLPSPLTIALLQLPALFYQVLIPALVKQRMKTKGITTEEKIWVHEHAAKVTAFAVGLHFAFGLALTGMTRPSKVLGFFNLTPDRLRARMWDPSLAMVAVAAIPISSFAWFTSIKPRVEATRTSENSRQTRGQRKKSIQDDGPLYQLAAPRWRVPTKTDITWRLIAGAVFFGIGWGMTGLCPGPALVAFGASTLPSPQDNEALIHLAGNGIFVGAMALGGLFASSL